MKKLLSFGLSLFISLLLISCGDKSEVKDDSTKETVQKTEPVAVTLMHVNDTHSHLEGSGAKLKNLEGEGLTTRVTMGGFARLSTAVKSVRQDEPDALLIHAGDVFSGTLFFTKYLGMADLDLMKSIGFDIMTLGNHEFDKGVPILKDFIKTAGSDLDIISANVEFTADDEMNDLVKDYTVKVIDGEKIAFIGLVTPTTKTTSSGGEDAEFSDYIEAAEKVVGELEAMGINKIVAVTHLGFDCDIKLAESVEEIDVVIGGHSHELLGDLDKIGMNTSGPYPTVVEHSDSVTLILQGGEYANILGISKVYFDENGVISKHESVPIVMIDEKMLKNSKEPYSKEEMTKIKETIQSIPELVIIQEDPEILKKIAGYSTEINEMKKQKVAVLEEDLTHVRVPDETAPEGSEVAPLVTDAMLWKAREVGQEADIALQNAGGVRIDLPKGDLTVAKAYELMPFGNTLFLLEMTGEEVKKALEQGIETALNESTGAFPYVSGLKYTAEKANEAGQRVTSVEIVKEDGSTMPLDDSAVYLVVVNGFIASGGDNYQALKEADSFRYDTGFVDAEVFMEYMKKIGTVGQTDTGNVTFNF